MKNRFVLLSFIFVAAGCTTAIPWPPTASQNSPVTSNSAGQAVIKSFTIEPSRTHDGWRFYKTGASAVLNGSNIARAEVRYLPTGTGIGLEYPDGKLLGQMKKQPGGSYTLKLPTGLMTTNFWVVVTGSDGKKMNGPDLGNVAEDVGKIRNG